MSSACLVVQQTTQPTVLLQLCLPPPTPDQKCWDECSRPLLLPPCCCNMCLCGQSHAMAKAVPVTSLTQLAAAFTCLPTYVSWFSCLDTVSLDCLSASTSSTCANVQTKLSFHGPVSAFTMHILHLQSTREPRAPGKTWDPSHRVDDPPTSLSTVCSLDHASRDQCCSMSTTLCTMRRCVQPS